MSEISIQQANKLSQKPANHATNLIYLVSVEDPSDKAKSRNFLANKVDKVSYGVELKGFEINNKKQLSNLKTFEDAIELAKKESIEMIDLMIPWQRVISIKNMSYKTKI